MLIRHSEEQKIKLLELVEKHSFFDKYDEWELIVETRDHLIALVEWSSVRWSGQVSLIEREMVNSTIEYILEKNLKTVLMNTKSIE